jgi:hypothetical protein
MMFQLYLCNLSEETRQARLATVGIQVGFTPPHVAISSLHRFTYQLCCPSGYQIST